ncbi:hypothetical protein Goshw_016003 [Gossypium schwendimanii]|uniref:Uncharacterized protein n=1 Tax=Gossypium schwendimanii TaxID=34291 RepID=A0A7J9MI99_GOSSC|nr:hypothetical protein [Gossypium schwendimanii]
MNEKIRVSKKQTIYDICDQCRDNHHSRWCIAELELVGYVRNLRRPQRALPSNIKSPLNANNSNEHCKVVTLISANKIPSASSSVEVNSKNKLSIPPIGTSSNEFEESFKEYSHYET